MDERTTQPRLEYVPLAALHAFPRNPKLHDTQSIHDSYQRFGFISPIIIDEKTGNIVAGHGRLETLLAMKQRGEQPPDRIIVKDEHWLVPVIRGLSFNSEKEAQAYLLADNQLTIAAGFNEKLLAEILPEHAQNVAGLGFSQEELQKYIPQFRTIEVEPEPPPIQEQTVSRTGDLWVCGPHRVLCGDSTTELKKLKDKEYDLCLTDPPYGNNTEYGIYKDTPENLASLIQIIMPEILRVSKRILLTSGTMYHRQYPTPSWTLSWFVPAGIGNGPWGFICWNPILAYGNDPYLEAGKGSRPDAFEYTGPPSSKEHPVAKPLPIWQTLLERGSINKDDKILDPFLGSGTTIIAAENLGRIVTGIELEPKYVDVAVRRWQNASKKDARLGETGPTFTQVQAERLNKQQANETNV